MIKLLGTYMKESKSGHQINTCTHMFIVVFFTGAKTELFIMPSIDEWIINTRHPYTTQWIVTAL